MLKILIIALALGAVCVGLCLFCGDSAVASSPWPRRRGPRLSPHVPCPPHVAYERGRRPQSPMLSFEHGSEAGHPPASPALGSQS